ncbi:MAG: hypothetical protein U1F87_00710 [Kiritimatiellia bacterium]
MYIGPATEGHGRAGFGLQPGGELRHRARRPPLFVDRLVGHGSDNTLEHNHISDLFYSGFLVGCVGLRGQRGEAQLHRG